MPPPATTQPPDASWNALMTEWLAGLFMAPLSPEAVESYRATLGRSLLADVAQDPGCSAGAASMHAAITAAATGLVACRLAAAFVSLFDGVGGPRTVPLYESAYTGTAQRLFQTPTGILQSLLRDAHLTTNDSVREPPDHLSIELALLAALMRRERSEAAQIDLLDQHLLQWVPPFARRCAAADPTGFYAGAASVLLGVLTTWRAALERALPQPLTGTTA